VFRKISSCAALACVISIVLSSCGSEAPPEVEVAALETVAPRPEIYAEFTLTADLSIYTDEQREMIGLLVDASQIMDDLFWRQAYGDDYESWLASIGIAEARLFADQNYGPWDRLDDFKPFIDGAGARPPGANLYPEDMTREEFEAAYLPGKTGQYSLVRRNAAGELTLVPYHVAYAEELAEAAALLHEAADLAVSTDFANYLKLRAAALISSPLPVCRTTSWPDR
jgi:hypothetical protein